MYCRLNCYGTQLPFTNDSTYKLYKPKFAWFSDNVIIFAVNGLLYSYFM